MKGAGPAACPASGYQETHSPGGRRSAPDPTPVALRICANGITPDAWTRLRAPRVLCRALAVKAGLD